MKDTLWHISWFVWGGGALLVAVVFAFIWPKKKGRDTVTAVQFFLLRWGHALVWLLLSTSFFLRGFTAVAQTAIPNYFGLAALAMYFAFLAAVVATSRK